MSGPAFVFDHDPKHGQMVDVTPTVRRITAKNGNHFTFHGTGTYVVGHGAVAVIDPGPATSDHIDALLAALDGETITHVLVTHTHSDHSPGTALLKERLAERGETTTAYGFDPAVVDFGDFVYDFAEFPEIVEDKDNAKGDSTDDEDEKETIETEFVPDVYLNHGDVIEGPGFTFEALHTPGHISNHVCFGYAEERGVFTGDHIMGWSTSVIPAPDGSLTDYLSSLQLMVDRSGDEVYWPTHGAPITDPQTFAQALLDHRNSRTAQILACLNERPHRIRELVDSMYADKHERLHRPAAMSVLAHLIHLIDVDKVRCDGDVGLTTTYELS